MLGGLFDNIALKLKDPAVEAGLLQAGLSMLNANPNQSPFAQVANGIGQGFAAHTRYQDMAAQEMRDRQDALAAQAVEDQKAAMRAKLDQARLRQIENSIRTSQQNAQSLTSLRAAQTERAKRPPASGGSPDGSKAFSSAWRAFYRNKVRDSSVSPGFQVTPEVVQQWKSEFEQLESGLGSAVPPGTSASPAPTLGADMAAERAKAIQILVDEEGYTPEDAAAQVDELFN